MAWPSWSGGLENKQPLSLKEQFDDLKRRTEEMAGIINEAYLGKDMERKNDSGDFPPDPFLTQFENLTSSKSALPKTKAELANLEKEWAQLSANLKREASFDTVDYGVVFHELDSSFEKMRSELARIEEHQTRAGREAA